MSGEMPADVNPYQIEPQLSAYAPRPPRIDRDRLMFEAGRAAAASHPSASAALALRPGVIAWFPAPQPGAPATLGWVWPTCTAAMTCLAVALGLALVLRSGPDRVQVIDRVIRIPSPTPQATPDAPRMVSSGGLNHDFADPPPMANESPALTLESLPENHLLRVRQAALTQGDDMLSPQPGSDTARLTRPPTRGSLMRQFAAPPAAAARSAPVFRWQAWFGSSQQPANANDR
jgi:hypothetical protein